MDPISWRRATRPRSALSSLSPALTLLVGYVLFPSPRLTIIGQRWTGGDRWRLTYLAPTQPTLDMSITCSSGPMHLIS